MAWLGKTQTTCGRPIPKPEKQGKSEEIYEDAIPIQDQIENLRAKISLKGKLVDLIRNRKYPKLHYTLCIYWLE